MIGVPESAVHRTVVCVDVEGFGARRRTHPDQLAVRDGLYRALRRAFTRSGVCWEDCYREDRGDGALILVAPEVPKALLAAGVPGELAAGMRGSACLTPCIRWSRTATCHLRQRWLFPHMQQAVNLARTSGYRPGLAAALNGLGWVHALLGNAQQALTHCEQSLALFQCLGHRWGEASVLDSIGYAHHCLGRQQQAASYLEQALSICRELGDLHYKDTVYDHLGDAHYAAGNTPQARNAWQQALSILDQLGDTPQVGTGYADPDTIRAKLRRHS